ncbi:(2,3-dihydroxybenzoyl)adenylate synthase [Streptomyces uncialis]|uniref:2,3-dihydroxybenzoate-AMP ligase n=1 Tax=Streptomyces uncialis TaxID=1048205 RepID=A0A1Q4V8J7_9ACTN|nr:AMP-binding protein [Streptomyces uncialis]OKH94178.1 hypothetical protein AB852_16360 [Streptomyces uncialis]
MPNSTVAEGFVPWPAGFAERYRAAGHWRGVPLGGLLREAAGAHGERIAVADEHSRWSFTALDDAADRTAAGLRSLGVAPGDRVVVHLPNRTEFAVLCFALFRLGALPVLALPAHGRTEIRYLSELSGAVAYVGTGGARAPDGPPVTEGLREACPSVRHLVTVGEAGPGEVPFGSLTAHEPLAGPDPDPSGPALLLLSGGSTGLPKLIPRTHDDYAYNARTMAAWCGLTPDDTYLAVLPVGHNFPLACPGLLGAVVAGSRTVLTEVASPPEVFPLIERERVTVTALVPPLAALWTKAAAWVPADLGSLRLVQVGGARLPEATARALPGALGCGLQQVFGMAEGLLCATRADDPPEVVATTQGRPVSPDDEILVVGEDGAPVPDGTTGELLTRGPYTLRGYYRAEAHNAVAFTPDGHYRSGDLVRRTAAGDLVVEGRVKEQINRGGEKVSPEEVETHLLSHPAVDAVVVVGVPDDVLGERVCAWVRPAPGADPAALTAPVLADHLRAAGLAAFKRPDQVETAGGWPVTGVGKVDRRALTARGAERSRTTHRPHQPPSKAERRSPA